MGVVGGWGARVVRGVLWGGWVIGFRVLGVNQSNDQLGDDTLRNFGLVKNEGG